MDFTDGHFDGFAGAGEFVGALAVDFDGGEVGDALFGFAEEVLHNFFHSVARRYRTLFGGGDNSLWVASGGSSAEMNSSDVFFIKLEEVASVLRSLADEKDK